MSVKQSPEISLYQEKSFIVNFPISPCGTLRYDYSKAITCGLQGSGAFASSAAYNSAASLASSYLAELLL